LPLIYGGLLAALLLAAFFLHLRRPAKPTMGSKAQQAFADRIMTLLDEAEPQRSKHV